MAQAMPSILHRAQDSFLCNVYIIPILLQEKLRQVGRDELYSMHEMPFQSPAARVLLEITFPEGRGSP